MSELSELIEINRNIEKQNEEIIRLLKKIAGEDGNDQIKVGFSKKNPLKESQGSIEDDLMKISFSKKNPFADQPAEETPAEEELPDGLLQELEFGVGDVYYIEGVDLFALSIQNNERMIDNLTGDGESINFNLAELVANESIKNNQSLDDYTVIVNEEETMDLSESLRVCHESGARKVFIPWSLRSQLLFAPPKLMEILKINFYKSDDELMDKLFSE
jgi:hypothetical protein